MDDGDGLRGDGYSFFFFFSYLYTLMFSHLGLQSCIVMLKMGYPYGPSAAQNSRKKTTWFRAVGITVCPPAVAPLLLSRTAEYGFNSFPTTHPPFPFFVLRVLLPG